MNHNAKLRYKEIDFPFTCPLTKKIINNGKALSFYLTKNLKLKDHSEYYDLYIKHRDSTCFFCNINKGTFISASRGYRNLCDNEICIKKSFNSNSIEGLMYRDNISREEAEIKFIEENEYRQSQQQKSIKLLKEEDPIWDQKRSQYSKHFWIKKGFLEEESIEISTNAFKQFIKQNSEKRRNNPDKYAHTYPTKIEYYLHRGFTEDEGRKIIKEFQNRFSKKKCIEKYGSEEVLKIFNDRQRKWQNTLINNNSLICGYSKISQELFDKISDSYINDDCIYYATNKNGEYYLNKENVFYLFDFVDIEQKKIIEYNGDLFHANTNIYESTDKPNPFRTNLTASEIWEKDDRKLMLSKESGFEVLVIWDSDYKKDPEIIIRKCLDFLNH